MKRPSARELRELYEKKTNILALLRESGGGVNDPEAVRISYDLQSGSYTAAWKNPAHRAAREKYVAEIAEVLAPLEAASLLEAGVGEATTLCSVVERLPRKPEVVAGFDLAWSRVAFARRHAAERGQPGHLLFTGDLFAIPAADGAFDVVYTAHSLEPNHGREHEALRELYRVAGRWLVLFEPSYELGNEATRRRIEEHGYVRGLPEIAREFGWEIAAHRLIRHPVRGENQTALIVIRKSDAAPRRAQLACPNCREVFTEHAGHFFCGECLSVFPVIGGIPCLLPRDAMLATKFLDF